MKTKEDYIKKWCELALTPKINISNRAGTSNRLKHLCESSIGVHVSNDELVQAMWDLGFDCVEVNSKGHHTFNISSVINEVVFSKPLGGFYDNAKGTYKRSSTKIFYDVEQNKIITGAVVRP